MDKEKVEKEGWKIASTTSKSELKRILDMYNELGLETCTEEVSPEECGGCTECFITGSESLYRIYTRVKDDAGDHIWLPYLR